MTASGQSSAELAEAFCGLAERIPLMVYDEAARLDRTRFEVALLCALGFSAEEAPDRADRLQQATCRLVWQRMSKSANARESRQTYDEWLASGEPFDANAQEVTLDTDWG